MQLRRGNLVALGDPRLPKACPAAPPSEGIFHPAHACWIEQPRAPQRAMHFLVAKPEGSHGQGATGTPPGCNLKQEAKLTAARERLWGHEAGWSQLSMWICAQGLRPTLMWPGRHITCPGSTLNPYMSAYTNAKSGGLWRAPGSHTGVTYVQTLEALFKTGSVHPANCRDKVWMVLL